MRPLAVAARHEVWPLRQAFTISRGSKTEAHVVTATVSDGQHIGAGEAVPYARYGETVAGVLAAIASVQNLTDRIGLAAVLKPGAALNALDCALWDLQAKREGTTAAALAALPPLKPVVTAYTLSLDHPEAMARAATDARDLPLLKLKLGGVGDDARMRAVRAARPDARLIVDANEAWTADIFALLMAAAVETEVEVIEQPLPQDDDEALRVLPRRIPVCADESVHTAADLPRLVGLYGAVNIKLDKAGGLTGALALHKAARAAGMKIMVGSMVATSLAVAPALLLAQDADWVDLDGPLLLARDRPHAIAISSGVMSPPDSRLWG